MLLKKNTMKKCLYIIILLIFNFCLFSCKTEKAKEQKTPLEELKKVQKKESYKVCLDEQFCNRVPLGNYAYLLRITPNLSKPKNDMEYQLLLKRDKKMYGKDDLKLNDTVVNMFINKKRIIALCKENKKDSINLIGR